MATDLEKIDQLLTAQEARFRRAFLDYVRLVQSEAVMAQITELLEARKVQEAFDILESYIARWADTLARIQADVGEATAAELAAILPAEITVAISFDPSNPRAAALVRTQRLGLIREFSRGQLAAVQQAITRALNEGGGAQETARAFRDAIGLTVRQEAAVASYRLALQNGQRDALDRALRDRRFDDRVGQAIEGTRPLTQRQIDQMVARYRARSIAARAETIARTEAGRATAEAREEAVDQMVETAGISRADLDDIWNSTRDERTRDWHDSMRGQVRGRDGYFVDGKGQRLRYPHDPQAPANTTISCRCVLTYRYRKAA